MSTDAKADGQFQPVHRAGYQTDKLAWLMQWLALHPDATLQSGEGMVLRQEIVRLREMLCESYLDRAVLRAQAEGVAADADAAARVLAAYRAQREGKACADD